jgi:hypothetical protein
MKEKRQKKNKKIKGLGDSPYKFARGPKKEGEIGYFYNLYDREQQLDLETSSRQKK